MDRIRIEDFLRKERVDRYSGKGNRTLKEEYLYAARRKTGEPRCEPLDGDIRT